MPPKRNRASSGALSSRSNSRRKTKTKTKMQPRHAPVVIDVDPETWDIRDPELDFFVPTIEYEEHPERFSVAFHHEGSIFEINKQKKYCGGRLTFFDFCNITNFDFLDLSSMVLKLKYDLKMVCEFYYCHPKYSEECMDVDIGGPLMPLIEEPHLASSHLRRRDYPGGRLTEAAKGRSGGVSQIS